MKVEVRRSARRSIELELRSPDEILVRAPARMSQKNIEEFLYEKRDWIEKHSEALRKRLEAVAETKPLEPLELEQLQEEAAEKLPEKIRYYASLLSVKYNNVYVKNLRSRWGSCSQKKNLNFNTLLMLTPEKIQDYVVVHELCHLKEMNHSSDFWKLVEQILPDYRERRQWLKDNGTAIIRRMTG